MIKNNKSSLKNKFIFINLSICLITETIFLLYFLANNYLINVNFILLINFFILIILWIILPILWNNLISKPLNKIIKVVNSELATTIDLKSSDEIGILAEALNKVSIEIHEKIDRSINTIQSITYPLYIIDNNKNIIFFNKACAALTGYSIDEALGKRCDDIFKSNVCYTDCVFSECIKNNKPSSKQMFIINKQGKKIPIVASASIVKDSRGSVIKGIIIIRDISIEKKLHEEQEKTMQILKMLSHEVQKATSLLTNSSQQILLLTKRQTENMEKEANSINSISSTINEMSTTTKQVSDRAENVLDYSRNVVETSEKGKTGVNNVNSSMNTINDKVGIINKEITVLSSKIQKIGKITRTINEIARHTNLLALNASLESARAGEEGRGFSIVADEIRKLAASSAKATEDIQILITELQRAADDSVKATEIGIEEVNKGVYLVNEFHNGFENILDKVKGITNSVKEITLASKEQTNASIYLNTSMLEINENMKSNLNAFKQSENAAEELDSLAKQLNELVKEFNL